MNFSFLLRLAATRMRSRACDASARPCVRDVLCGIAFPSVPALGSTCSAAGMPVLFAGFTATSASLTSPVRSSSATAPHLPDAIRRPKRPGWARDLPVPEQKASAHARPPTAPGVGTLALSRSAMSPSVGIKTSAPEII